MPKNNSKLQALEKLKENTLLKVTSLTKKSKKRKLALTHAALVHTSDERSVKEQLRLV